MELIVNNASKFQLKETEVGLLPTDWEVNELSHYFSYISYGFTNPMPTVSDGVFMITANDIKNGNINYETARKTSHEAYHNFISDKSRPKVNDILLTKDGTLGRLAVVDETKICINQSVAVIRPNGKVDPTFLKILLESSYYQRTMIENAGGSTIKHIYITIVDKMKIGVPPSLEEQKAISTALSDIDVLISGLEKLISKKKAIKQGAMQQLLTPPHRGGKRLPGFSGDWKTYNLKDVVWFQEGPGVRNYQFTNRGVKLLNGTNIQFGVLSLDKTDRFISENEAYGWYSHFLVDEGDILIACSGISVARFDEKVTIAAMDHLPLCMNTSTMRFKMKSSSINKDFFMHFLKSASFKDQIGGQATGSAQLNFGPSHVEKVVMEIPEKEEQKNIAQVLSDMDKEIEVLESKKTKYEQIKQGMMQELLTGKTRLV